MSPSSIGIESGILISLYSILKLTYLPVPFPVSPFVKCISTSGFLIEIVVPSFEICIGDFSIVGVSSVEEASLATTAASVVFPASALEITSVFGVESDTSSAYTLGAIIISNAAVKITPQRP